MTQIQSGLMALHWLRVLVSLRVILSLAKYVYVFGAMMKDLFKYFIILMVTLVMFVGVFTILFQEIEAYNNFEDTLINLTGHMLGGPDFDSVSSYSNTTLGNLYYFIFFAIMAIVLLNFIVALLDETNQRYAEKNEVILFKYIIEFRSRHGNK